MTREDRDAAVRAVITDILTSHDGEFNPAWISHRRYAGGDPGVPRAFAQLDELLEPGQLREWVEASDEFEWNPERPWMICWAASSAASGATSSAPGWHEHGHGGRGGWWRGWGTADGWGHGGASTW